MPPNLRKLAGAAVRHLKSKSVKRIALALESGHARPEFAAAAVEGAILGDFEPDRYKTGDDKKSVDAFTVAAGDGRRPGGRRPSAAGSSAEAQNFTRDLVNEPANLLTPVQDGRRRPADGCRIQPGVRSPGPDAEWKSSAWARCWAWRRGAPNRRP